MKIISCKWTTETPTSPGLYWYRQADGEMDTVYLDDDLMNESMSFVSDIIKWWNIVAWSGPIMPPEFDYRNIIDN